MPLVSQCEYQVNMATIKFTEDQYKCLLEVLAYNQQDEERDVCEKYPALDEMGFVETSSYSKQLKMLREVGATDHIYYARCIAYLAIDGLDEEAPVCAPKVMTPFHKFLDEFSQSLIKERIRGFDRKKNTEDTYLLQDFLVDLHKHLDANYHDDDYSESDKELFALFRADPEDHYHLWMSVCEEMEEYYKMNDAHKGE